MFPPFLPATTVTRFALHALSRCPSRDLQRTSPFTSTSPRAARTTMIPSTTDSVANSDIAPPSSDTNANMLTSAAQSGDPANALLQTDILPELQPLEDHLDGCTSSIPSEQPPQRSNAIPSPTPADSTRRNPSSAVNNSSRTALHSFQSCMVGAGNKTLLGSALGHLHS